MSENPWQMIEIEKLNLSKSAYRKIRKIYEQAGKNILSKMTISKAANKLTGRMKDMLYQSILNQIDDEIDNLTVQIDGEVQLSIRQSANLPVIANNQYFDSLGLKTKGMFSYMPTQVITRIMTGKLYGNKWSYSTAIWGNGAKIKNDIHKVVSVGLAENRSVYDIAKDLEKYVTPSAIKPWDWSKVYPHTNKVIDYNAQRLARTLIQHAYQVSLVETLQYNPFCDKIRWNTANSHRVCNLCKERNGTLYDPKELPLDHPNGMCYFTPYMDDLMTVSNRLADWKNGKKDTDLDTFYKKAMRQNPPDNRVGLFQ